MKYFDGFNFKIFHLLNDKNNNTEIDKNQLIEIMKFIEFEPTKISNIIKEKFEKINSSMVDKKNYIEQVNEKLNFLYPNHF
jgi:Ca2+-binding EF-hand superfamily protein